MSDIDALLRDFRAHVPDPVGKPVGELARGARSRSARSRIWTSRRRVAGMLAGGLAMAGLAGVVVVLFVAGPKPAVTESEPRVDWGMTAVVRVTPDPAVGLAEATDRAIAALRNRGEERDVPGLVVTRRADGEIEVKAPGAVSAREVRLFLVFSRIEGFRTEEDVLGTAPRLSGLSEAASGLGAPDRFGVADERSPGLLQDVLPTQAAAEKRFREMGGKGPVELLGIPPGTFVLQRIEGRSTAVSLVRDSPVIRSSDVESVEVEADRLRITLRDEARARIEQQLRATASLPRSLTISVRSENPFAGRAERSFLGTVTASDALASFDSGIEVKRIGEPIDAPPSSLGGEVTIDSSLSLVAAERYGTQPQLTGETVTVESRPSEGSSQRLESGVLVATGIVGGQTLEAIVQRDSSGSDSVYIRTTPASQGSIAERFGVSPCNSDIGPPAISICTAGGTPEMFYVLGRARTDVMEVQVTLASGTSFDAEVENGWFLALVPNERLDEDVRANLISRIVARGKEGTLGWLDENLQAFKGDPGPAATTP